LQYQPEQVCQVSQVHKIRETNFVDLRYITCDFKIPEQFSKVQMITTLKGNFNLISLLQNFHAKRQGGGKVTFFLEKTSLLL
jgi:hypothetical protein